MSLARAFASAGPHVVRQRLVALGSSSRLTGFASVGRTVAPTTRPAPALARSLTSDLDERNRKPSLPSSKKEWPPKGADNRKIVKDRIYVGNLPMDFTEDGLRELLPELSPSSVELGVPKPNATRAHGFLRYDSREDAEAALVKIGTLSHDAGPLVASFAARGKTEEELANREKFMARKLEKAAARAAELEEWHRKAHPPSSRLRISGLHQVSDASLTDIMVPLLEGWKCSLSRNLHRDTGRPNEFAIVRFGSVEVATEALAKLKEADLSKHFDHPAVNIDFPRDRLAAETTPRPELPKWRVKNASKSGGGQSGGGGRGQSSGSEGGNRSPRGTGDRTGAGGQSPRRKDGYGMRD